jgi:tRNA dimethylallyltransferase
MPSTLPAPLPADTITVLGPTSSGKTALAVALARHLGGEILSIDSRMVYQELDIGCGKDRRAYGSGPAAVPVHLMDLCGLDREFSLYDFQQAALAAFADVTRRGRRPVACGGSGLYLDCLLAGYRLEALPADTGRSAELQSLDEHGLQALYADSVPNPHNTTDTTERQRLERAIAIAALPAGDTPRRRGAQHHRGLVLGLRPSREELRRRIEIRLDHRLEEGMVEEARALLAAGHTPERLSRLGLEYRWLTRLLVEGLPFAEFHEGLLMASRQFARRQWMWFRRMEREGLVIHWLELPDGAEAATDLLEPALEAVAAHDRAGLTS